MTVLRDSSAYFNLSMLAALKPSELTALRWRLACLEEHQEEESLRDSHLDDCSFIPYISRNLINIPNVPQLPTASHSRFPCRGMSQKEARHLKLIIIIHSTQHGKANQHACINKIPLSIAIKNPYILALRNTKNIVCSTCLDPTKRNKLATTSN